VLLVDHSTHSISGAGALIYPAGSALRAEVRPEVECDLMKRRNILSS
jgi:hypothetical protein